MSHEATNWAFRQRGLSPAQFRVLVQLADRHNPDYGCFPSQDSLARDCEVSRATVNRCLDELEAKGLIERLAIKDAQGRQKNTRYVLGCERTDTENARVSNLDTERASRVSSEVETVSQNETHKRNPVSEPVKIDDDSASANDWPELDKVLVELQVPGLHRAEWQGHTSRILLNWKTNGFSFRQDVLPAVARVAGRLKHQPNSWNFFTGEVAQSFADRTRVIVIPNAQPPPAKSGFGMSSDERKAIIRKAIGHG